MRKEIWENVEVCFSALVETNLKRLQKDFEAKLVGALWDQLIEIDSTESETQMPTYQLAEKIFPKYLAPVIYFSGQELLIEPMSYSVWLPLAQRKRNLTSYNARIENLSAPFWREALETGCGVVIMRSFFEWVRVIDLICAKQVSINEVTEEFTRQKEERRKKLVAQKKNYTLTKTEKLDPLERRIVVNFFPEEKQDLIVPVIFNRDPHGQSPFKGFAVVTTEPCAEIVRAGHDRSPLFLCEQGLSRLFAKKNHALSDLEKIFTMKASPKFVHKIG